MLTGKHEGCDGDNAHSGQEMKTVRIMVFCEFIYRGLSLEGGSLQSKD